MRYKASYFKKKSENLDKDYDIQAQKLLSNYLFKVSDLKIYNILND